MKMKEDYRYQQLAAELEARIRDGTFQAGEKMPSIRKLHRKLNLSMATVYQAYTELESLGLVEARSKSGYYVLAPSMTSLQAPALVRPSDRPREIALAAIINSVVRAVNNPDLLPLGSSVTSAQLLPYKYFSRIIKEISSREMVRLMSYSLTEGLPELRRQLALGATGMVKGITPEDIIITNGCMEAVALSLQAIVKPGQIVAIEAPTHFAFLQLLKELDLKIIEVPTDPSLGVDVAELAGIIQRHPVKACLFMPNFHNPSGALMPDEKKAEMVDLLGRREIPLIEDDLASELYFDQHRPPPLKSYDRQDLVLTCSSFSKTLAPGLRIGWVMPGRRFRDKILRLKAGTSIAGSTLDQHLVARYLAAGAYDRHVRTLRSKIKNQVLSTARAVSRYFPKDCKMALPRGGPLLWVELNKQADSLEVYRAALEEKISILPGVVCSSSGGFKNYIRLGCGYPYTRETEDGIAALGGIIDNHNTARGGE